MIMRQFDMILSLVFLLLYLLLFIPGCSLTVPLSDEQILPKGVANGNFEKYQAILDDLKRQVETCEDVNHYQDKNCKRPSREEVYTMLNITDKTPNIRFMKTADEKMRVVKGTLFPTQEDVEQMSRTDILIITWRDIYTPAKVTPLKAKVDITSYGPDTLNYLIFERELKTGIWELVKVTEPDRIVDTKSGRYITTLIGGAASSASGGGAREGVEQLIK